jgi:hypothetical protein
MTGKSSRKFVLIGILSIVILTLLAMSAVPVMADSSTSTTTTTPTTTTTTTPTTTTTTKITTTTPTTSTTTTPKTTTTTTPPKTITTTAAAPEKTKPTVTGVNPNQASQGDTLNVTVSGTKFTGATGVSFGRGITVNNFSVTGDTAITANITIGDHARAGSRFVGVATPSGKGVMKAGFTVEKNGPVITGVSPNTGSQGATLDITINGASFTGATGVSFGRGIKVNSFSVTSDTVITANITIGPHADAGSRFVGVANPSGKDGLKAGFTVEKNGPEITAVSPNEAIQGATLDVTINGADFTGATGVSFGRGIKVNSFTATSDTAITANITIGPHSDVGSRFVGVAGPSGKDALKAGFTVNKNESNPAPSTPTTTTPKTTPASTTTTTPKT